ncbi:MAG: hypothetical protein AAGA33_10330 [Pseudomonadota bacterium]
MFVDLPLNVILTGLGAFVLGWVLSVINSALSRRSKAKKRDARDDRIRSLEAEVRVAQTDLEKAREKQSDTEKQLDDTLDGIEKRDNVISHQQEKMDILKRDLTDSVKKTRELRAELSNRATENVKSEAKLREVETELSIAQASTDLIATGVLDYSLAPEKPEEDNDDDAGDVSKTAS